MPLDNETIKGYKVGISTHQRVLTSSPIDIRGSPFVICPVCKQKQCLGGGSTTGGVKNILQRHLGSKECNDAKARQDKKGLAQSSLLAFARPKPTFNTSVVAPPHPITQYTSCNTNILSNQSNQSQRLPQSSTSCPQFLLELEQLARQLPDSIPEGLPSDSFAMYSGDPKAMVSDDLTSADDIWEQVVSRKLHHVFWGKTINELVSLM